MDAGIVPTRFVAVNFNDLLSDEFNAPVKPSEFKFFLRTQTSLAYQVARLRVR